MPHETSSWHAEVDLRVFVRLHHAGGDRMNITPAEALGVLTDPQDVQEVVARLHHMLDKGWIDGGEKTTAEVSNAALSPMLHRGMAEWVGDRCRGDVICDVLADDDAGRPVEPERFVALRDNAIAC